MNFSALTHGELVKKATDQWFKMEKS